MAALTVEDCLTEALNQARRWWGYSGNTPTNSRDWHCNCFLGWVRLWGTPLVAPRGTIRMSNNISSSDQLPLLTSAWLITGVFYLPKPWVTEPLGKASPSSTGLEALSQGKMKTTRSKHMWMEEITKYFTVPAYEAYVENTDQKQNPMPSKHPHPSSPLQFILDISYHVCTRGSPLLDPSYTIYRKSSTEYCLDYLSKCQTVDPAVYCKKLHQWG